MRLLCILLLIPLFSIAQKHDYVWVVGANNDAWPDFGGSVIDFNGQTVDYYSNFRDLDFREPNTSICNTAGNLLFYSNGCDIAGADDTIIENGDNINAGFAHDKFCDEFLFRQAYGGNFQSMLTLPLPDTSDVYWMFHQRVYVNQTVTDGHVEALLCSKVDMRKNNGVGKVIEKDIPIIEDTLALGQLNAVKHANGKDWWLVVPRRFSNTYYTFLFTSAGITDTIVQSIGDPFPTQWEGGEQSCFSPGGSVLVRYRMRDYPQLRYFDRSTGLFTGYEKLELNYDTIAYNASCCISPNSRYLYIAHDLRIYQYDLMATDISSTQTTVGWYDGFKDPIGITFNLMQLAPDCKIYVMGGGDTKYFHIIHRPDEPGTACDLEMRGLVLPTPKGASMPFPPNYRLGPLDNPGLPCSSTVDVASPTVLPSVSVFPNPTTDKLKVLVNRVLPQGASWQLYDMHGRTVRRSAVSHTGGRLEVDVSGLGSGLYFWVLRDGVGQQLRSGKVVKE